MRPAPTSNALNALALVAALAVLPWQAQASDACPLHDWLLWLYTEGEAIGDAPDTEQTVRTGNNLARAVASADHALLARLMGQVGLDDDIPTVEAYLDLLRARLVDRFSTDTEQRAPTEAASEAPDTRSDDMRQFMETLTCAQDRTWKPEFGKLQQLPSDAAQGSYRPSLDMKRMAVMFMALTAAAAGLYLVYLASRPMLRLFDRRRTLRHPCHMRARLQTESSTYEAVAIDISRKGAKLQLFEQIPARLRCTAKMGDLAQPCRVIWSNQHFVGIVFQNAIEQEPFDALLETYQWDAPVERDAVNSAASSAGMPSAFTPQKAE